MSIEIHEIQFDGPYTDLNNIQDQSGVYAILDQRSDGTFLLDVGESSELKSRLMNHDRRSCWDSNSKGKVSAAVKYTPNAQQAERKQLEEQIRDRYQPSCGDR